MQWRKTMKRKILPVLLAVLVLSGTFLVARADSGKGLQANQTRGTMNTSPIRIAGADSMYDRISGLCRLFMQDHPGVNIIVSKGSLVDEGMESLIGNDSDVAMASRKAAIGEKEAARAKGVELVEHLIGYGGIVIVTEPSNSLNQLSLEQVRKILKGEYTNWNQVGGNDKPIIVFKSGEKHPGTLMFIEAELLGGSRITEHATVLPDFLTIMQTVSKTPGAIGYTRIRDVFESPAESKPEVKVLKIKKDNASPAITPSRETILNASYPIRRPYYLYTTTQSGNEVKSLVDFISSKGWGGSPEKMIYIWK
jgi:phosphate transport system substrate-binding protein